MSTAATVSRAGPRRSRRCRRGRRAVRGRGRPSPPRPDRGRRRQGARVPARRPRGRTRRGRAVDAKRAAGEQLGPLAGVPLALKDVFTTRGVPTTCGSRILEGWRAAVRRDRHQAAARRRRRGARQDQHGRVRHGLVDRELRVRADPQPLGPEPHPRRLVRRLRGRGRRGRGAARHRHRHRRLDPPAGRRLRARRRQADVRRGQPLRAGGVLLQPRSGRPVRPHGARRRAAARGDRRARSVRLDQHRHARCPTWSASSVADLRGVRIGVVPELSGEGYQPGVEQRFAGSGRRARGARRRGRRGQLPEFPLRAAGVLPDRAERVQQQPGPLRRDALRPSGRRRRGRPAPRRS